MLTKRDIDEITYSVIGAAIEVHKTLGPGLLESVYQKFLKYELSIRGLTYKSEMIVPVQYKNVNIDINLRCDLYIEECLVVDLKTINSFHSIHFAQLLTYMKLLKAPKGILINFHCAKIFKEGQKTFVNEFFRILPDE